MPKSRKKSTILKPSKKILALISVIVLLGFLFSYVFLRSENPSTEAPDAKKDDAYINLEPATEQERRETEAYKKDLAENVSSSSQNSTPTPTTQNGKKQVMPFITAADIDRVAAYVSGIFEEGGTCTATFTKGNQKVTKTSEGFATSSYTSCTPINPGPEVSGSGWYVFINYNSSTAEGESQSKAIN